MDILFVLQRDDGISIFSIFWILWLDEIIQTGTVMQCRYSGLAALLYLCISVQPHLSCSFTFSVSPLPCSLLPLPYCKNVSARGLNKDFYQVGFVGVKPFLAPFCSKTTTTPSLLALFLSLAVFLCLSLSFPPSLIHPVYTDANTHSLFLSLSLQFCYFSLSLPVSPTLSLCVSLSRPLSLSHYNSVIYLEAAFLPPQQSLAVLTEAICMVVHVPVQHECLTVYVPYSVLS